MAVIGPGERHLSWMLNRLPLIVALLLTARCADPSRPTDVALLPERLDGPMALVDVTVIPMTGPSLLARQTVLIESDRIVAVGPTSTTPVPAGFTRLMVAPGSIVMPGLADMHTHILDRDELLLYLANGVTTIRNLHGLGRHLAWRDSLERNLMVGPRLLSAGPILDGDPPSRSTNIVLRTEAEAAAAVAEQRSLGFDYIKVYDNLPAALYRAVGRAAASHGLSVIGHLPTPVGLNGLFGDRVQSEVQHLEEFLPFVADGRDLTLVDSIVRGLQREGIAVVPTVSVYTSAREQAERLSQLRARPEMAYVNPATAATWGWEPTANSRSGRPGEIERYRRTVGFFEREFLPRLRAAGVSIVAGTDAPVAMVIPGFAIHDELASYVAGGLTTLEAVRTATTAAAAVVPPRYGLTLMGTVSAGAPADLLVLSASPLENLGNLKHRMGVVARGRWFSAARLQRSLDSLAAVYRGR